jgi:type II restriction enzyme
VAIELKGKGQALRLGIQQELGGGPLTIFGAAAQKHDLSIREVTAGVLAELAVEHPNLEFRQRDSLSKSEIHKKLTGIDPRLGQALFVASSSIRPDGAITEVKDRNGNWRVILVGESKHQGNDIEKITAGVKQGKNKDQLFMVAGNAIERVHKNVLEMRNFMIDERHFPYVVFLQGSNFATATFDIQCVDGSVVTVVHNSGMLNRIDRVTASSLGRAINQNYCENIVVAAGGREHMLQIASLYFQANPWEAKAMAEVMLDVAKTSLAIIGADLEDATG